VPQCNHSSTNWTLRHASLPKIIQSSLTQDEFCGKKLTPFPACAVNEDLLTLCERAKVRELNARLEGLKGCKKTERQISDIAHEIELLEELQNTRASARIDSLIYARGRLKTTTADFDAGMRLYEEALLNLDENDYDDFENAFKKSRRLELIEQQSDEAGRIYNSALLKLGWEIKEAQKIGII
jgi:hypothetical protein